MLGKPEYGWTCFSIDGEGGYGKIVAKVPFSNNTFANIWQQNHLISYYEVEFQ